MAQIPRIPFFFRIYAPDEQGIVYRADRKMDEALYMCTGSRQIGDDSGKIWEVGGYADAMPLQAMHSIIEIKPMSKARTVAFVRKNGLDAKYNEMSLYADGNGYFFAEKQRSRSRSRSNETRRRSKSRGHSKSKRSKSKNARANA
jgi:hypothetical protein